ncbi:MAG: alcohol dehydrogenase catalytic domain-containing protein [Anaerolineaceae bacterium]|nr:alcohol dehydrogenase catalytic domain-containing protein [Anaerolineaceae bacterium]
MKAARIERPGQSTVVTADDPMPGADDVLIKVRAAGICGTDLHIFKGEYEAEYPIIPGHEFSGEVAAVGANVVNFKVGDRVTADPNIPCNRCYYCQRNEPNQCKNLRAIGVTRSGAFAEYVIAPEGNVFNIGDITYGAAALIEPLACVVWGIKRVDVQAGDTALVFGAGPMGLLVAQSLKQAGAHKVVVTDVVPWRLQMAEQLGATHTVMADNHQTAKLKSIEAEGYDIVVDATGIPAVLEGTFPFVKPRGKVWVFGVTPQGTTVKFPSYEVFRKDLQIIGSFAVNRTFPQSIALIQNGAIKVEPLISHQLPLDDFSKGLELAEKDPKRVKVQFNI